VALVHPQSSEQAGIWVAGQEAISSIADASTEGTARGRRRHLFGCASHASVVD
jgi:hypothetical protein